ncbi:MAG TPA: hypothetical protein VM101_15865 [Flavitalea sp.]|nr:hypothetical protein [Flavitalea sp.]
MNKQPELNRKVEEAMNSLMNIARATPQPFFYTRLMARLSRKEINRWERVTTYISRPAFAFITVSMVLMLNIFVASNDPSTSIMNKDISEAATADDFGTNSFYDIENVQP